MKASIIGLPQVGKTALFTILTGLARETRMGGTAVQVGTTKVPDGRLDALAKVFQPDKVTHATVEYADMPGLSKEVLREPSYLGSLRVADAFCHVLRAFEEETVMHVKETVDPKRDWQDVELELVLNDLEVVERRLERVEKDIQRIKNPDLPKERELLQSCKEILEAERPLRELELDNDQDKRIRGFQFLSRKPMLLVLNIGEADASNLHQIENKRSEDWLAGRKQLGLTAVCGSVEAEIAELQEEEAREYLESYGLKESGLQRLIQATYSLLGVMSFLTAGEKECRAWTIPRNTRAAKAAGAIHSDFEQKFIRAEVIPWEQLVELNGYAAARQKGVLRLEGKDYIVQEGDVLVIRHG